MRIAKILLSILLITALLAGCAPAAKQTGTTQKPTPTTTQPQPTVTEPPVPTTQAPTQAPTPAPTTQPPATEAPSNLAPDFTVYDLEGNEVKLSDFLGKPVILNFWASWCAPCLAEMGYFNKKFQEYGDQIQFLMVNGTSFDSREDAYAVLDKYGYVFPVFYDDDGTAAEAYNVSSIPVTYLIDTEGNIIEEHVGSLSRQALQKLIDKLLAACQ